MKKKKTKIGEWDAGFMLGGLTMIEAITRVDFISRFIFGFMILFFPKHVFKTFKREVPKLFIKSWREK